MEEAVLLAPHQVKMRYGWALFHRNPPGLLFPPYVLIPAPLLRPRRKREERGINSLVFLLGQEQARPQAAAHQLTWEYSKDFV